MYFLLTYKGDGALCRALANNMVLGTSTGWTKTLSLVGVGYRASVAGNKLTLNLGYSHPIEMEVPKGLDVKVGQLRMLHCQLPASFCSLLTAAAMTPEEQGNTTQYAVGAGVYGIPWTFGHSRPSTCFHGSSLSLNGCG